MKPISFIISLFFLTAALFADEGMWPLNSLPKKKHPRKIWSISEGRMDRTCAKILLKSQYWRIRFICFSIWTRHD